jgi:hypothetical protein
VVLGGRWFVLLEIYQAKDMILVISRLKAMSEGGIRGVCDMLVISEVIVENISSKRYDIGDI